MSMSFFVDVKYLQLISPRFEGFHRKSEYLWNCRCFLCGDSQRKKTKMRGYFFRQKDRLIYKCHNCLRTHQIQTILKQFDPVLYKEYVMETYRDPHHQTRTANPKRVQSIPAVRFDTIKQTAIEGAERCDYLPEQHHCRLYLTRRQIPVTRWSLLHYTDNYETVIRHLAPQELKKVRPDTRLLIPFYDAYGVMTAISGRALAASAELRYVTIRIVDDTQKLVYGLERMKSNQPLIMTEGPLDSLFFPNAVASGDANLALAAERVQHEDLYLVFDNERRNKEIVETMRKAIHAGYRVMFWPETIRGKDVNEMILNGHTCDELTQMIYRESASGLSAQTKLSFWKKVTSWSR